MGNPDRPKIKISYAEALKAGLKEPLYFTALIFGDVYRGSFEQWWERQINNPMSRINPDPKGERNYIKDAMVQFLIDVSMVYSHFRLKNDNEEPNEDELSEKLRDHFEFLSEWGTVRIEVDFNAPMEQLVKEFRGYMSQRKKEKKAREFAMKIKGIKGIPTKDKLDKLQDDLKHYLDVYDLWKEGLTFPEIIEKIGTTAQRESLNKMKLTAEEREDRDTSKDHRYDIQNIERMYRRDLEKAKAIIDNVGRGYFPGKYDNPS